jgi:CHAD domain-containing protein
MGYKLKAGETIEEGIRRVVVEEIDTAIETLGHRSRLAAVHEARKSIKKIRAVLRLARSAMDKRTFAQENANFREIGRQLSDVRDADILVQSFDKLKPEFAAASLRPALTLVAQHVQRRRRTTLTRLLNEGRAIEKTRAALRAARARVRRWRLRGNQWSALSPGFERVYAQGRKRFAAAYDDRSGESFHLWRKRVKDLTYQFRLLHGLWPKVMTTLADESSALADMLGDDHDLVILQLVIRNDLHETLGPDDRDALVTGIDRRRAKLEADAEPLGRRLYADAPKACATRLEQYWDAWRLAKRNERRDEKPSKA